MRKQDELTNGCMAKARDDEMTFVLLGRDAAAPAAIRAWIAERIRIGKNAPDDPQIVEAEECARTMEYERGVIASSGNDDPITLGPGTTTVTIPLTPEANAEIDEAISGRG